MQVESLKRQFCVSTFTDEGLSLQSDLKDILPSYSSFL